MARLKSIVLLAAGLILCSAVLIGCEKLLSLNKKQPLPAVATVSQPIVKGTIVAKVGSQFVTLEDLDDEVSSYNAMIAETKPEEQIKTRQQKIDYLKNQMVRRVLLYQEALDRGLDRKEEVIKALDKTKQDLLVLELLRQEAEKVEVSAAEIENYYNTFKDEFKDTEERRIRVIGVSSEQEAREALIQLLQGSDFATLAKERSKLSSAADGGDLGFITKGKNPQFDTAAFSETLEVGKVSNIFKGTDGTSYIFKLEDKRGGKVKTLNEMWDEIKRGLTYLKQQQKIDDLVGKLSRDAKIEIREGEIKEK